MFLLTKNLQNSRNLRDFHERVTNFYLRFGNCIFLMPWCSGYHYCTTLFIKPELRLCAGSNLACGMSEIRDGVDLWLWFRQKIRLNTFRQLTVPQKQFIIIRPVIKVKYFPQEYFWSGAAMYVLFWLKQWQLFIRLVYSQYFCFLHNITLKKDGNVKQKQTPEFTTFLSNML